jgi:hypothetical protein
LWQVPLTQDGVEKHVEHFVPQLPQLLTSVWRLTHAPLHTVWPVGHEQLPLTQDAPPGHAVEQLPQWLGSLDRSTHALPHMVCPDAQVLVHCPDEQTSPAAHA